MTWIKQSGVGVRLEFLDQKTRVGQQCVGRATVQKCSESILVDWDRGWAGDHMASRSQQLRVPAADIHVETHIDTGKRAT